MWTKKCFYFLSTLSTKSYLSMSSMFFQESGGEFRMKNLIDFMEELGYIFVLQSWKQKKIKNEKGNHCYKWARSQHSI